MRYHCTVFNDKQVEEEFTAITTVALGDFPKNWTRMTAKLTEKAQREVTSLAGREIVVKALQASKAFSKGIYLNIECDNSSDVLFNFLF